MSASPLAAVAARLRAATLASWADHPPRFREDANAEEDHGGGWYRDRVVVELAQNAADAALASPDGAGRLLLRLDTAASTLVAANTGAPLSVDGLTSLASLRASAKRGAGSVGRFGVGFAAVRSVSDDVCVVSTTGAVHFRADRTAAELAALAGSAPGLADEVARRAGSLPMLRLPFDGPGDADPGVLAGGWDTAVVLRLRDAAAVRAVREELTALDDALLLALPGLARVVVDLDGDVRELADVADRWVVVSADGELEPALLADRPVEERERTGWRVTWAVPIAGAGVPSTVHAPTPTDDALTVPAVLLGTFPLDPGRRRVTPGAVTDRLVAEAGRLWPELLGAVRRAHERAASAPATRVPDPLDLLPSGFPAGPLDAAVRDAVLAASRDVPVLPTTAGWVSARDALALAPPWDATAAAHVLGEWFAALVTLGPDRREALRALGVTTTGLAELVEQLPETDPARLRAVYELLAGQAGAGDPADELGAAPVPLADGRLVHGARGLVMLGDGPAVPTEALEALVGWGLRLVHPDAAHPVLERLGAQTVSAAELAAHPVLRDRVLDGDPAAAPVLLALVEAAGVAQPGEGPSWWSEVLLMATDGEPGPARGLVLPGSPAAAWFDPEVLVPVAAEVAERWAVALPAVGVRAGLVVERVDDLVADLLDDWPDYLAATGAHDDGSLLAVVDLDAVRDWPGVLAALGERPDVLAPVRDDGGTRVPSYVVWRLRDEPALGTGRPFAMPDADRSGGVLAHLGPPPPALAAAPDTLLRALGGVDSATDLTTDDWAVLLDELDPGQPVPLDLALDCWRAIATFASFASSTGQPGEGRADLGDLADAPVLPAWDGERAVALPADDLVVADPAWRRLSRAWPVLPVPFGQADAVADALDLDLAAARTPGRPGRAGTPATLPSALRGLVAGLPATWRRHDHLTVDGTPVAWWLDGGVLHATDAGLPDGLAALTGLPRDVLVGAASGALTRQEALLALLDR